jgi:hypothetical protein
MILYHAHARTRWSITFGKGMRKVQSDGTRLIFETVLERRLYATALVGRKGQLHAKTLQLTSHILKHGCVELIAKTGDK